VQKTYLAKMEDEPGERARSRLQHSMTAREAVAYHEAGHVVIARGLGYTISFVTIIPDENTKGKTVPPDDEERRSDHQIIICFAGPAAQVEFAPHSPLCKHDVYDDQAKAAHVALCNKIDDTTRDDLRHQARVLVRRHRARIEIVAKVLLERDTLQGQEVDALLRRST
jgi:ATP-dependent Zn protease